MSTVRLCIDFISEQDLIDFIDEMKANGSAPEEADAYRFDGLDSLSVGHANTFILKHGRDRIAGTSIRDSRGRPRKD